MENKKVEELTQQINEHLSAVRKLQEEKSRLEKMLFKWYIGIADVQHEEYDTDKELILLGYRTEEWIKHWKHTQFDYDDDVEIYAVSEEDYCKYRTAWHILQASEMLRFVTDDETVSKINFDLEARFDDYRSEFEYKFDYAGENEWV